MSTKKHNHTFLSILFLLCLDTGVIHASGPANHLVTPASLSSQAAESNKNADTTHRPAIKTSQWLIKSANTNSDNFLDAIGDQRHSSLPIDYITLKNRWKSLKKGIGEWMDNGIFRWGDRDEEPKNVKVSVVIEW